MGLKIEIVIENLLREIDKLKNERVRLKQDWATNGKTYETYLISESYLNGQIDALNSALSIICKSINKESDTNTLPY